MSTLSDRQRDELHKSILDYFHAQGMSESFAALLNESKTDFNPEPKTKYSGLLEKKWTSVIRLQKKIMDLENKNAQLQEEVSMSPARRSASQADWVPRAPARYTLTGHRGQVLRVTFHPTYSVIASASEDATVKIWDWETGEFERTLKGHTRQVLDVHYDSKGNKLVSCSSDLTLRIWDVQNEYSSRTLHGHDHSISSARFVPGDDLIVSASRDNTIKVWDVTNGWCVKTFTGHAQWVRCVVPSEDGKLLASCSDDQASTARIWDISNGETKMEFRGHDNYLEVVAFAPIASYPSISELSGIALPSDKAKTHGQFIATGSRDKSIKLWDVGSGQCIKNLAGHDNWVRALVFHPCGTLLLSAADDKTIRVWDLKTGRCVKTVEAHGHFVTSLAWGRTKQGAASDAKANGDVKGKGGEEERVVNICASGSTDQTIKIWSP
ncbi:dynein regulator [Clavulina sp. PMI_390]|nr:dynein regulator [Clavulina sp. PMI_390]